MSKIIELEERLQQEQKKKSKAEKAKKLEFARRFMQCKRCLARCAVCGIQFDTDDLYRRHPGPFRFCKSCQEEYEEFQRIKAGGKPKAYWHNKAWLSVWEAWLAYQEAISKYTESPEFIELLREVDWQ